MTPTIFVGPTLTPAEIAAVGDFVCLPPVAQGDVYRAARRGARPIGIIDGYFSGAPAVWHKEILWAMSEGVAVLGSASMGALRAAELHTFGMRGVGRIFEAYRDGALEDDDEVAVLHGPAEIGYLATSEPMVNIRATLEAAEQNGVVGAATRVALESFGKSLFFGERSWPTILKAAPRLGVANSEVAALEAWLPEGRIDQKRLDALAMLAEMHALGDCKLAAPNFHFEWTYLWGVFVARSALTDGPSASASAELVLDELRLEGSETYQRTEAQALLRFLTSSASRAEDVPHEAARDWLARFRAERGLYGRADLDRWMSANDLDPPELEALIKDEAKIEALRDRIGRSIDAYLLDALRLSGDYPRLADRARRKQQALAAAAQSAARPNALESAALRIWRFEKGLGKPVPDDLGPYVARLGFADLAAFDLALYRERVFLSLAPDSA
jgi:hypothetical protein